MARRIWYCSTCGYETAGGGRCHQCRQRLVRSPLAELEPGSDEDEVGYRLDAWEDEGRGELIVALVEEGIPHRFENDELVVAAEDEARVDDLVAEVAAGPGPDQPGEAAAGDGLAGASAAGAAWIGGGAPGGGASRGAVGQAVATLADAARRLEIDPTDMQADGDVGETSAVVFAAEEPAFDDPERWAALGRVTRRLLAALGAEEALEGEIAQQAGILVRLLREEEPPAAGEVAGGHGGEAGEDDSEEGQAEQGEEETTAYELPEWLPEERAELELLLDRIAVPYRWDGDEELVVPAAREEEVEGLFAQVRRVAQSEDEDENRYHQLEELFAAADRLVNDPDSAAKSKEFLACVGVAAGAAPVGLDEALWWEVRSRTRTVADALVEGVKAQVVMADLTALRDVLRALL